jgi:hypothetical protein
VRRRPRGRDHWLLDLRAAEYFVARAEWLHAGSACLHPGALVEPFTVAYAAVRAGVSIRATVAVLGGGPIGLLRDGRGRRNAALTLIEPGPTAGPRPLARRLLRLDPARGRGRAFSMS